MIRMPNESCKEDSATGHIPWGSRVFDSRDTLVKDVSLDICREWERRDEHHEPLPKDFEDVAFLVGPFGFVESIEEDGVKFEASEREFQGGR